MNIVLEYLADVFYLPSSESNKKPYKPWAVTEGRAITDKEHMALYKEKEETKSRKEKEKEDKKKAREQKQQTKLIEEETKSQNSWQKRKKDPLRKALESSPLQNICEGHLEKHFDKTWKDWCVMKALIEIVRIVKILMTGVECASISTHL